MSEPINRRQALAGMGSVSLGALLAACGADDPRDVDDHRGGDHHRRRRRRSSRAAAATSRPCSTRRSSCTLTPEETEGPFYFDADAIRSDIREDREGTTLRLALRSATPRAASRSETPSSTSGTATPAGPTRAFEARRGRALPARRPGDRPGRDRRVHDGLSGLVSGPHVHIHAKVHLDSATVLTTQLYFDEAVTAGSTSASPTPRGRGRDTFNDNDGIFDEALLLDLPRRATAISAWPPSTSPPPEARGARYLRHTRYTTRRSERVIHRSADAEIDFPQSDVTSFVLEHAAERGDKPALIDGPSGRTITYAELAGGVKALAAGLAERGFGKGDVLAIYMPNVPEYAIAFHGAAVGRRHGRRPSTRSTPPTSSPTSSATPARSSCSRSRRSSRRRARRPRTAGIADEVYVLGEAEGAKPFADLLGDPGAAPEVEIDPARDLAVLPVLERHDRAAEGRDALAPQPGREPRARFRAPSRSSDDDTLIGVLPFFHIYGMTVIMNQGLRARGDDRHDAALRPRAVPRADRRARRSPAPTWSRRSRWRSPSTRPSTTTTSRRCGRSCPAPRRSARELAETVAERIDCDVIQGYGLTETSPVTHVIRPDGENQAGLDRPAARGHRVQARRPGDRARTSARASAASFGSAALR